LFNFLFRNHPIVLGENYSNFYRVLGIFAAAFKSDVLTDDDEIKQRMILILKQAQVSILCQLTLYPTGSSAIKQSKNLRDTTSIERSGCDNSHGKPPQKANFKPNFKKWCD
jgi:hypothetical protein